MQHSNGSGGRASGIDQYLPGNGDGQGDAGYGVGLIDISAIRAFIWRQKFILAGITALVVLAGLVATLLMTPMYEARGTLRLDLAGGNVVEGADFLEEQIRIRDADFYLRTLTDVIKSRRMALKVVDELNLHENETLLAKLYERGRPAGTTDQRWDEVRRMAAASMLMGNVDVESQVDNSVFTLLYRSPDPQLAAAIANGYAEAVLIDSIERGTEANSFAREYLEEQIAEARVALQDAEIRAIGYARSNRIVGTAGEAAINGDGEAVGTAPTITGSNVTGINQAYITARSRLIEAEQRWRAVANLPAASLPEVQQNPSIQTLRTRRAELDAALSDLRSRYRDEYPQIREAQAELSALDAQIAIANEEVKNAIRNEFLVAQRQSDALARELGRVTDDALNEQDRRVQYNLIDRDVAALRTQLSSLLERYNLISAASNLRSSEVTIIDPAIAPGAPVSPDLTRNLLLALILGLALATLLALAREIFDDRLRSVEEVERKLGVKSLGQIPDVGNKIGDELEDPFSPVSEAYSSIRATLDYQLGQKRNYTFLVTSTEAGEGKTTSAIALARKFAKLGRRVLIVDLDLRRPAIRSGFGLDRLRNGVVDVLFSRVSLEEAVVPAVEPNLDVLAVSEIPNNPVEILSSGLVPEFIEKHSTKYDVIVFDGSPVLGIADAPLLARHVDGVVFVIEANRASSSEAKGALRRLRQMEANVAGIILTKYRALNAGQNYRYQYQYYSYQTKS